jgi:hypothetical protein
LKNLKELFLKKIVLSYQDGLSHWAGLKQLKKPTFVECGIAEDDLGRLKAELPETRIEFSPAAERDVARWNKRLEGPTRKGWGGRRFSSGRLWSLRERPLQSGESRTSFDAWLRRTSRPATRRRRI